MMSKWGYILLVLLICGTAWGEKKAKTLWILPNFTVLAGFGAAYGTVFPQTTQGTARTGWVLGGQVEQPIGEEIYLNFGLQYSERGVNASLFQLMGTNLNGLIRLDYIDFIFTGKWKLSDPKKGFCPFVEAGGYFSLALNRNILIANVVELGLSDRFDQFDYGLVAGAGLSYKLSGWSLIAETRFLFGLADIDSTTSSFNTRSFQFLFGAQLPF